MFKENELDLLIPPHQSIIDDLLRSGLWSHVPHDRSTAGDISSVDHLLPEDRAAVPRLLGTDGTVLTLWPEHIYHLSVASTVQHNIQVPDFYSLEEVLVEESMCPEDRVPRGRLMSERNAAISKCLGEPYTPTPRYPDTPLFIPTIADFLQACCASVLRLKEAGAHRLMRGRFGRQGPSYYLSLMIRYLWLERDSQRAKLRAVIVDERVWDELQRQLDGYVRTNKRTMVMEDLAALLV